ncbi:MAG: thioredoxin family protein [Holophagaceae bacterium]|nr:thioredoxin family protein [Holophagaceae bacterium]
MAALIFSFLLMVGSLQETPPPQSAIKYNLIPAQDGCLPLDSKDNLPVIIGQTSTKAILEHRPEYKDVYEQVEISQEQITRWQSIKVPCTFVVVFGSWCADSHHWVPDLIKLSEIENPFISIYWIGTYREKNTELNHWPPQTTMQKTEKVPTFWLFTPTPGGGTKLVGKITENPPKVGQTMAAAILELLESLL